MKPEITKIIEQYLQNELSAQDRAAFIRELNNNADLLRETALQQSIHEGAKRLAQRTLVQKTARRYHLQKTIVTTAVVVVIATAIAATVWLTTRSSSRPQQEQQLDAVEMAQLIEKIEEQLPLDGAPAEYFNLSPKDTVVLSESGILLSVPEEAFMTGGKIYEGPKVIQWQEAFDAATIVKCGLSTMAGDRLLETQGMFGMQAFTPEGKQLDINPKVGVYVQIPVAEHKEGMMLFEGKKGRNGIIDWQNPKPLEKLPVLADMSELDFYPPGYEAYLDELKWKTGRKDRDSLYLSFEKERASSSVRQWGITVDKPMRIDTPDKAAVEIDVADQENPGFADVVMNRSGSGAPDTIAFQELLGVSSSNAWTDKISWSCRVEKTDKSHGVIVAEATLKSGEHIFPAGLTTFGMPTELLARPNNAFSFNGPLQDTREPDQFVAIDDETMVGFTGKAVFRQAFSAHTDKPFTIDFDIRFQICNESRCLAPATKDYKIGVYGFQPERTGHIPPSKVLAFWKKEFNNTILATRDFERRMQSVHGTCSEEVLDLYTDNLNKPLYEIDAMVAKLGHDQFNAFAEERVGGVQLDNPHMNNIRRFYAGAIAKLQKEAKQDRNFVRKQEAQWNAELRTVRGKAAREDDRRNWAGAEEEKRFNRESIARQFSANTVSVTIFRNAPASVYNCDRFAGPRNAGSGFPPFRPQQATQQQPVVQAQPVKKSNATGEYVRETERRISPTEVRITTQRASIVYNDFALGVADAKNYGKLMLYLFPHELNSFLRIDPVNGKFSQRLNNEMMYDVVVIGISEDGYFLYEKRGLNKGDLGNVALLKVSEETFTYRMQALNRDRGDNPRPVALDLDWLTKERKNYTVQRQRQENAAFRDQLRPKVFPCVGEEMAVPMSDSIGPEMQFADPAIPFLSVDEPAQFPGGNNAMRAFLSNNLKYPESAIEAGIEGKCNLRIQIDEDGSVGNVTVARGIRECPECDAEAVRVVKQMPDWIPAMQNGIPVKTVLPLPVTFALSDDEAN